MRASTVSGERAARRILFAIMAVGLAGRLALVASRATHEWFGGGDGPWYARQGWLLAHGALPVPPRTIGPLYPLLLAGIWRLFPGHPDPVEALAVGAPFLTTVRVVQAILGTLTVAVAFALTRRLTGSRRGALVTAAAVGLGPAFVMEPFLLHTETLFMTLLTATVCLAANERPGAGARRAALTGAVCALAALTRPVLLLFPVLLAIQPWLRHRTPLACRRTVALLLACGLVILPWLVWLREGTGHWLPDGFATNLWMAGRAEGQWIDAASFHAAERDLAARGRGYADEALRLIATDPGAWLLRRASRLLAAVLQPHGVSDLGGPSVKDAGGRWLRDDRSIGGALGIAALAGFWTRLATHAVHVAALALAMVGTWKSRRRWRDWWPVYAAVLYPLAVHALLPASPRYLFPSEVFLWVLAGVACADTRRKPPRAGC